MSIQEKILPLIENEKIIKAKFYIPSNQEGKVGKYKFIKLKILPSNIKNAGMGCFTLEDIPKGAKSRYKGVFRTKNSNVVEPTYSWAIYKYNKKGITKYKTLIGYLDALNTKYSNWTRYVNCATKNNENNMEPDQNYDKLYYVALRDIKSGEELYIDYGIDYRIYNLNMKGEY